MKIDLEKVLERHIKTHDCHSIDPFKVFEETKKAALEAMKEVSSKALDGIDWSLLAIQKEDLVSSIDQLSEQGLKDSLDGILHLIDELQDEQDGVDVNGSETLTTIIERSTFYLFGEFAVNIYEEQTEKDTVKSVAKQIVEMDDYSIFQYDPKYNGPGDLLSAGSGWEKFTEIEHELFELISQG